MNWFSGGRLVRNLRTRWLLYSFNIHHVYNYSKPVVSSGENFPDLNWQFHWNFVEDCSDHASMDQFVGKFGDYTRRQRTNQYHKYSREKSTWNFRELPPCKSSTAPHKAENGTPESIISQTLQTAQKTTSIIKAKTSFYSVHENIHSGGVKGRIRNIELRN